MDQQIMFYSPILSPNKGGEKRKKSLHSSAELSASRSDDLCQSNRIVAQSGGATPGCGRRNLSDLGAKSHESRQNMRQNADLRIINIYIYSKPGRIGFFEAGLLV